ncbi:MAG: class I SAM-dependent methyltransferase, partial [Saprospiraceae bacterium]
MSIASIKKKLGPFVERKWSIYFDFIYPIKLRKLKKRRKIIIKDYFENEDVKKLHLGCGTTAMKGWLNADLFPINNDIIYMDVGQKFPLENETFDYVFSEHLFEHLTIEQASVYLSESLRVLKKGGKIRISLPNLDFLKGLLEHPTEDLNHRYLDFAIEKSIPNIKSIFKNRNPSELSVLVVNNFFRDWYHEVIYDFKTLKIFLEEKGFENIEQQPIYESGISIFQNLEQHHKVIPLEFNKLETMCIEAS